MGRARASGVTLLIGGMVVMVVRALAYDGDG
jgi:hypothetical protein